MDENTNPQAATGSEAPKSPNNNENQETESQPKAAESTTPEIYVNEKPAEEYKKEMEERDTEAPAPAQPAPKPVEPQTAPTPAPEPQPAPKPVEPAPAPAPAPQPAPKPVEPTPAPKPVPAPAPQPAQPVQEQKPEAPAEQPAPEKQLTPEEKKAIKDKKKKLKKKKAIMAGVITGGVVFVVIIAMIFLLLTQGGGANNPLLKMFGISEDNFYPFLITLTNIIFGLGIFIAFIVGVIGLFKTSMSKKEDKQGKKKGIILASVGGFAVLILAFAWTFTYMYLSSQYTAEQEAQDTSLIQTEPEELTGLTAPMTIEFDASGIPFNPYQYEIISYEWDFGDGSVATGEAVSHRYTSKGPDGGRYAVLLEITYRDVNTGEEDVEELTIDVVFSNESVAASIIATPESGPVPLEVDFDASESVDPDGEIIEYEWDLDGDSKFDDGEGVEVSYTYDQKGSYEVTLRVTDNNGEYSTATVTIEAGTTVPTATITEYNTEDYLVGEEYSFSAEDASSPNGDVEKYEWDFGDGSGVVKTKTAKHTYDKSGVYTITLTMTDEEGFEGEEEIEIEVGNPSEKPVAAMLTVPGIDEEEGGVIGEIPLQIAFDATESTDPDENIIEYEWDFDGDEVVDDTGETATYIYQETGIYTAQLTVTDADGNQSKDTVVVIAEAQGLTATLSASPVSGEVPLEIEFDASGSTYPGGEIVAYTWDFGDGSSEYIGGADVEYEYDEIGTFEATVTVRASDGEEDSETLSITVRPVELTACFEPNVEEGDAPLIVTFDPICSEGSVQSYSWDFGDGDKSYDRKPTHTYAEVGVYTVELEVEDASGVSDSYESTITVVGEVD